MPLVRRPIAEEEVKRGPEHLPLASSSTVESKPTVTFIDLVKDQDVQLVTVGGGNFSFGRALAKIRGSTHNMVLTRSNPHIQGDVPPLPPTMDQEGWTLGVNVFTNVDATSVGGHASSGFVQKGIQELLSATATKRVVIFQGPWVSFVNGTPRDSNVATSYLIYDFLVACHQCLRPGDWAVVGLANEYFRSSFRSRSYEVE